MGTLPHRPVVAIDVDGTIGKYHDHFIRFAAEWLDGPLKCDWTFAKGEFSDALGLDKETYRKIKLAYRAGGQKRTMPVFNMAITMIEAIRSAGAEVWICTTRPWQRMDNIDPDTQEFFRRNNIKFDGLIYGETKYDDLVEIVGADRVVAVLDDEPIQYERAESLGLSPILRLAEHNRWYYESSPISTGLNCATWRLDVATKIILDRIEEWKKAHMEQFPSLTEKYPLPPEDEEATQSAPGGAGIGRLFGTGPMPAEGFTMKGSYSLVPSERHEDSQRSRVGNIFDEAQTLFMRKSAGYGEPTSEDLGLKGQYADMHRKWKRLRKTMWDGEPWGEGGESLEEVLLDMMGHCGLAIDFVRQQNAQPKFVEGEEEA